MILNNKHSIVEFVSIDKDILRGISYFDYSKELLIINWREILITKIYNLISILPLEKVILKVSGSTNSFTDFFKGFEKVEIIRRIFGEKTEDVLRSLKVEFTWIGGYMWVNGSNGHLIVNSRYLKNGDRLDIYLDVIHELAHIKQLMEGKELFDRNYKYVERPTEIEAYQYAVTEAKRLKLNDEWICRYLKTEWMSNEDLKQLARNLNINC